MAGEEQKTDAGATDAKGADSTTDATLLGDKADEQKTEAGKQSAEEAKTQETEKKAAETQTEKKDEKAPTIPEKYELKIPDGHIVNEALMADFTKLAKESGFTNEKAQAWADLHMKSIGEFAQAQAQAFEERVNTWAEEFKNDKDLQGADDKGVAKVDVALSQARKVLSTFGTPEEVKALKALLDETGVGNFRVLIKGLARFAQFVGEDNVIHGTSSPSAGAKTAEEVLYGKQA